MPGLALYREPSSGNDIGQIIVCLWEFGDFRPLAHLVVDRIIVLIIIIISIVVQHVCECEWVGLTSSPVGDCRMLNGAMCLDSNTGCLNLIGGFRGIAVMDRFDCSFRRIASLQTVNLGFHSILLGFMGTSCRSIAVELAVIRA